MGTMNSYMNDTCRDNVRMELHRYENFRSLVEEVDPSVAKDMQNYRILGFNKLSEWAIASLCDTTWTDDTGMDFSNGMDLKMANIQEHKTNGSNCIDIGNLTAKTGDIIVISYDTEYQEFRFFLLPYAEWKTNYNPNRKRGCINMHFPRTKESTVWWAKHEKKSLKELVKTVRKASK